MKKFYICLLASILFLLIGCKKSGDFFTLNIRDSDKIAYITLTGNYDYTYELNEDKDLAAIYKDDTPICGIWVQYDGEHAKEYIKFAHSEFSNIDPWVSNDIKYTVLDTLSSDNYKIIQGLLPNTEFYITICCISENIKDCIRVTDSVIVKIK